jgi:hypothetical protein
LIEVTVAEALPLLPNATLYAISSQIFTFLSFKLSFSANDFLIRRSGAHNGSSSHFSSFGLSSGATHATFL